MIINPQVPLHRLIMSLSEVLDYVHPHVYDHQLRVAYISTRIARRLGFRRQELLDVFHAAALHDIGLIRVEHKMLALHHGQLEKVAWHPEAGFELLRGNSLFANAARIIRYHHTPWANGAGTEVHGQSVPLGSQIVHLADAVERAIDRGVPVLEQAEFICKQATALTGKQFHPDCIDAFRYVARSEAFWLDCVSERIYSVLLNLVDWPMLTVDEGMIEPIAEMFGLVVDAMSQWTTTHSAGVTASAVAISERLDFSPREQRRMRAAGYLHDIGKLSVRSQILEKPGELTPAERAAIQGHSYHTFRILNTIGGMPQIAEWAAFHHERLDGNGYPFHHDGDDLTLGSRIMAVADVYAAVTEDRPYRRAMSRQEAMAVLDKLVENGGVDGGVVAVLQQDCEEIEAIRREEQASYARKQAQLARFLQEPSAVPDATAT